VCGDTNNLHPVIGTARLADTLDYVRRYIPFYSESGGDRRYRDLEDFPVLDSADLARYNHRLYYLENFPDFIATTGGTTSQNRKLLIRNYAELDAAFMECAGGTEGGVPKSEGFNSFTLNLTDFQHGLTLPPRHGQSVVSLPLESGRQLPLLEAILREGLILKGRRIGASRIIGSATKLRALTAYCAAVDAGFVFHVHELVSTAFYCSQIWRRKIREYWGAELRTAYGLSEFPEVTTICCPECGLYHLPPTVHSEILALHQDTPIVGRPGRLVLTSLLPFRRAMPLIRFDTGDIVEIRPTPSCSIATTGIEFFGREAQVLFNPEETEVLLTPFDVVDAVEDVLGADLVRGTELETVMRFGIGDVTPDFSSVGYPEIRFEKVSGTNLADGFRVIAECSAQRPALGLRLRDALNERVNGGRPAENIDIVLLEAGGLAERGLMRTLV
jgi:hypothetical protein